MQKSDSIQKLAASLVKVQAELKPVLFNATNPFLHNRYANLGAIVEASIPVMSKHGLAITQLVVSGVNQVGVTTILLHESGEFIETTAALPLLEQKQNSVEQVAGKVITYLRRYSWASILGLYAEEDTDGNEEKSAKTTKTVKKIVEEEDTIWSQERLDLVKEVLPNIAPGNEQAAVILDLSTMPIDVTTKTLKSWLGQVKKGSDGGASLFDAAEAANNAYKAAVSKK